MALAELSLYSFVLFVHIAAAIVAFGVTFAYPVFFTVGRRGNERNLPFFHRAQSRVGRVVITPAATLVLLAGIYLAIDGPYDFGDAFVGAGILIILVLMGVGGAFFSQQEAKLAEIAERDLAASRGTGQAQISDEYDEKLQLVKGVSVAASALVLVAVYLMVTKPGA